MTSAPSPEIGVQPDRQNVPLRVVAPDPAERRTLEATLARAGIEAALVDCVGPHDAAPQDPDAAVVIWHRAGGRPLSELVRACAAGGARVLVFTDAHDEGVLVSALDAGARQIFRTDESERVMIARLRAALRRPVSHSPPPLRLLPFTFDLARRIVHLHDEALDLSPREFDLAYYLFHHRGRVVTNAELLTSVWSLPQDIDSRRIDTAVCRVRRKMHLGSDSGWVLRRFRREGYGLYQDSRDVSRGSVRTSPVAHERRGMESVETG